jgi:tRNA A-37 threonylcarbamoyl transferase component Bud32
LAAVPPPGRTSPAPELEDGPPRVVPLEVGGLRWLTRGVSPELLEILEDPEAFLRDPTRFIKSSRVVTLARARPGFVLRRLNYGKLLHRLRDAVRPSRAVRVLFAAAWLARAGIPTPQAFAAAEVRTLRWPRRAYVVTEEVAGARTLGSLFNAGLPIPPGLPELIARLHDHKLQHLDLKWTNILFDARGSPWLIDLDGVRRVRRVDDARAAGDLFSLARCFAKHPQVLKWQGSRFLRRYCAHRTPPRSFRSIATEVLRRLQAPNAVRESRGTEAAGTLPSRASKAPGS